MKFGYARISTPQQNLEYQIANLEESGCQKIFSDVVSGAKDERPGFQKLSEQLREGDIVAITTLDRLGRSSRFLLNLIEEWHQKGIHLHILSNQIDTTTSQGKFMFGIMAALAEQERTLIRERIKKGLEGARARGRKGGRPPKLGFDKIQRLKSLYAEKKWSIREICEDYKISKQTLYNYLGDTDKKNSANSSDKIRNTK